MDLFLDRLVCHPRIKIFGKNIFLLGIPTECMWIDAWCFEIWLAKRWYLSFSHQPTKRLLQHLLEHLPALLAQYPCSVLRYFNPPRNLLRITLLLSYPSSSNTPLSHYCEKKREKRPQQFPGVKTQGKKVVVHLQEVLYPGLKKHQLYTALLCCGSLLSLHTSHTKLAGECCTY